MVSRTLREVLEVEGQIIELCVRNGGVVVSAGILRLKVKKGNADALQDRVSYSTRREPLQVYCKHFTVHTRHYFVPNKFASTSIHSDHSTSQGQFYS